MGRGASEHLWIVGKKRKDIVEAAARGDVHCSWKQSFGGGGGSEGSLESRDMPLVGDVAVGLGSTSGTSPLPLATLTQFIPWKTMKPCL